MTARAAALGALLLMGVAVAVWDLETTESRSVVVYTTAALRDVLEKDIVPRFENATGYQVSLVYVPAGQQYNRLQMSRGHQEADVFLHASPLFLEKGAAAGFFRPFRAANDAGIPDALKSSDSAGNGTAANHTWYAFAWSPVVEVYNPRLGSAPDLANLTASFGFPHPQLSNNGVYAVLLFENVSSAAGQRALAHTRVQPTNARTNIGGVADGSFDVTLGYEAVVQTFMDQGANLAYALPLIDGQHVTTRVLCSAALVAPGKPGGEALLRFLFQPATQERLAKYHFRPVVGAEGGAGGSGGSGGGNATAPGVDLAGVRIVDFDWTQWEQLDASLERYVIQ